MTIIDPSTNLGKLRLRCADFGDLYHLPDTVYLQTLADTNDNLPEAAKICATYILGMLSFRVRRKLASLEVFNDSQFAQYKEYLLLITKDPSFMGVYPIPYSSTEGGRNVISEFVSDWQKNYFQGTSSQALALSADLSPNDGSRLGFYGNTL